MISLDVIKALAEKATPGEWKIAIHRGAQNVYRLDNNITANELMAQAEPNREYIAACNPQVILAILKSHEILREALDWVITHSPAFCATANDEAWVDNKCSLALDESKKILNQEEK